MSAISQVSISRPVLAGVMSVLLMLFGIVGYTFLGTREYPVTDSPIVTITTVYPGRQCRYHCIAGNQTAGRSRGRSQWHPRHVIRIA